MDTTLSKSFGGKFLITFTFLESIFLYIYISKYSSTRTFLTNGRNSVSAKICFLCVAVTFRLFSISESELARSFNPLLSSSFIPKFFCKKKKQCIGEWSSLLGYHLQKSIRQVLNWMIIKLSDINAILVRSTSTANPLWKWNPSLVMKLLRTTQTWVWKQLYRVILSQHNLLHRAVFAEEFWMSFRRPCEKLLPHEEENPTHWTFRYITSSYSFPDQFVGLPDKNKKLYLKDSCCWYSSRMVHGYANWFERNTIPDVSTTT